MFYCRCNEEKVEDKPVIDMSSTKNVAKEENIEQNILSEIDLEWVYCLITTGKIIHTLNMRMKI